MPYSREHILAEIRRTAVNGKALGRERYRTETGIRESDWIGRYWARWSEAVAEAGCAAQGLTHGSRMTSCCGIWQYSYASLGACLRSQSYAWRPAPVPSFRVTTSSAALAMCPRDGFGCTAYCLDSDEFRDLAPLCAPRALAEEDVAADDSPITPPTDVGVVYLIRAGRHFKVGRTTSLDRRTRQLAIQLPERAVAVHAIRTDDPAGIERYWHGRFAAQRLNGEWFALTAADVSAFRRRKFM